jgi:hypothetical protein
MKSALLRACIPVVALVFAACSGGSGGSGMGGGGGSGTGELTVEMTDKPFAYDLVTKAIVRVDRIEIGPQGEDDEGFVTLFEGQPIEVDLLDLTNGATKILVRTDVAVGSYDEIRLRVVSAHLELIDGDVFSTELGNMHLTSTATSGLKIKIDPALEVVGDVSRTLLLDFDLTKSFHAVPANDPLNANSYKLMPVVHATDISTAGEVRGVVRQDDGTGTSTFVGVDAATVYLMPVSEPDPANSAAATKTDPDGSYALIGVPPGTWDVLAVKDPASGRVNGIEVIKGMATTVDLKIE